MSEREVLLSVQHLEQYFKMGNKQLKAVNDVSFDVYKGEVLGLVGESGCGKTTTGRSIIRLYNITGGSVYFKGQRICAGVRRYKEAIAKARTEANAKLAELNAQPQSEQRDAEIVAVREQLAKFVAEQQEEIRKAKYDHKNCNKLYAQKEMQAVREKYEPLLVETSDEAGLAKLNEEYKEQLRLAKHDRIMNKMQMIFQDPIASLNPRMTVREIIAEGLIIRGVKDKKYIDEQVYKVLDLVGLVPEHAGRYPHEFSGGQRQRICIARALAVKPRLVICDEPVSALDVSIQAQIINLLKELQNTMGLTYVFISHDLSVVKYITDQIMVMYLGNTMEMGETDELFDNPLHPYTQALFSAIPVPDPDTKTKRIILEGDIPSPANPPSGCKFHTRCSKCMNVCRFKTPAYTEAKPGHFVACHLYDNEVMANLPAYDEEYNARRQK